MSLLLAFHDDFSHQSFLPPNPKGVLDNSRQPHWCLRLGGLPSPGVWAGKGRVVMPMIKLELDAREASWLA